MSDIAEAAEQPIVPRKLALIGKAPSSLAEAPYGDPTWEVWILNTLGHAHEVPRWDRQFELHDLQLTKDKAYGDYYQWLGNQTRPVYLRDAPPAEFKAGVQYPLGPILDHFGTFAGRKYLTNTVSLMVALALYEHDNGQPVSDIGLWGIDMAQHALRGAGHVGWFTRLAGHEVRSVCVRDLSYKLKSKQQYQADTEPYYSTLRNVPWQLGSLPERQGRYIRLWK